MTEPHLAAAADSENAPKVLHIQGELTIYQVVELKEILLTALAEPPPLDVDLSGVTEMDTAGVQLLMLVKKTAQATQHELRFMAYSPAVTQVFELLDLAAYFDDPLIIASPGATRRPHES